MPVSCSPEVVPEFRGCERTSTARALPLMSRYVDDVERKLHDHAIPGVCTRSHLARARDNGVTQAELIETITHLAFYAGWPNAITAISVAKEVFEKR